MSFLQKNKSCVNYSCYKVCIIWTLIRLSITVLDGIHYDYTSYLILKKILQTGASLYTPIATI
jgi:hypothetical protein